MYKIPKIIWILRLISCSTCVFMLKAVPVQASGIKSTSKTLKEVTFMIQPEIPADNIAGKSLGYFNLPVKTAKHRRLAITVYNPTEKTITLHTKVVNANTLDDGVVNYTGIKPSNQALLPHAASYYVSLPSRLKLKTHETRRVPIKLNLHDQKIKGQQAMAVDLYASQANQLVAVKNHYIYAVGLILNGTKLRKAPSLKTDSIITRLVAKKPLLSTFLINPAPTFLKNVELTTVFKNSKWPFIQYKDHKRQLKIAPKTSFYNNLDLSGYRLVSGLYQMTLTVKTDHYNETIKRYVKISHHEAEFINRNNYLYLKNRNRLILALVVLIIFVLNFLWLKRRRLKRDEKSN